MKSLFIKYKSVIKFILTFLLVYLLLTVVYKLYLQYSSGLKYYPEYITHLVSKQTEALLNTFGYSVELLPHPGEPSLKIIVNNKFLGRIIEGCNGISVIVLFISFIVAFSGTFKTTLFYILSGSVLIYTVNLLRIVALCLGLYHYPEYSDFLHDIIFPVVIYGMMFLLWIFWVNRFSKLKSKNV